MSDSFLEAAATRAAGELAGVAATVATAARGVEPQAVGPLVLLCGPSGVGKTSVAQHVASAMPLQLLSQDSFFNGAFVPYADALSSGKAEIEEPGHIDWASLREAARAPRRGGRACLVEGHTLLSDPQLVAEAACILFLDATAAVCAARRLGRRQRSAQEDADIEAYYHRFVWPAHLEHVCVTAPPMPCAACPHALNIFSPHAGGR